MMQRLPAAGPHPRVFLIAPAFNEQEVIAAFVVEVARVARKLLSPRHVETELIVVDDGSSDHTAANARHALQAESPSLTLRVLELSRNFGQQAAIQAGLAEAFARASAADLFVVIDSDLQHPPELLAAIVDALIEGCDHVQMIRREPPDFSLLKRSTSAFFYWLLRHLTDLELSAGSSDFRGMNYAFLKAWLRLSESGRFNRGLFHWVGFERRDIGYAAAGRPAGKSKYSLRRMLSLALIGITQFSSKPLILLCSLIVAGSALFCLGYVGLEVYRYFHGGTFALGWPSLMFFIAFWCGAIALIQLVTAIYLARVFEEVKRRPAYIVRRGGHDAP